MNETSIENKVEVRPDDNYQTKWQNTQYKDTITISKNYFEHLLNCLANQKFIGELPSNGDALALGKLEYENIQLSNQKAIDKAWREGMFLLGLNRTMEHTYKQMVEKYCEIWNKAIPFMQDSIIDDAKKYPEDKHIEFKWNHLIAQEIEMWMRLCCFSDGSNMIIDCKNEAYIHGVVTTGEFDSICSRRGFTPTMRNFLIDILKDIGIGEQLCKIVKGFVAEKLNENNQVK